MRAIPMTRAPLDANSFAEGHKEIAKLSILVVDNNPSVRKQILDTLDKIGVGSDQIQLAEDGHKAITALNASSIDLVITDYNLSKLDGEELLKTIQESDDLENIPVIMVTTENDGTRLASIKNSSVTAMLDQPFDEPSLKELLESHM